MPGKFVLAAMLFMLATASHALPEASAAQQGMLDQLAIPRDYAVIFQDASGNAIPFDRFQAAIATRPFDIDKDTVHHRALLKVQGEAAMVAAATGNAAARRLPITGHPFPAFQAKTLDGKPVSLASLRGKPFVANFFFALCAPCIAETPVLSAFHRQHPEIPVVAFTFDDAATASEFVRTRRFNWPVVADQATLATNAGVKVYPVLMHVDAMGVVISAVASDAVKGPGGTLAVADLERWVGAAR